jgi:hypothetical protein
MRSSFCGKDEIESKAVATQTRSALPAHLPHLAHTSPYSTGGRYKSCNYKKESTARSSCCTINKSKTKRTFCRREI